jgi:hypothetical protein
MTMQYAYEVDILLEQINSFSNCDDLSDSTITKQLKQLKKITQQIQPEKGDNDDTWSYWIPVSNGTFKQYQSWVAEDEDVDEEEIQEELKFIWDDKYSNKEKWYRLNFSISHHSKEFCMSFDKYFMMIEKNGNLRGYKQLTMSNQHQLINFITKRLCDVIAVIIKDPEAYARALEKKLPKKYRFGRIQRDVFWEALDDKHRIDKILGKKRIQKFEKILDEIKEGRLLSKMTANDFFRYCAIGYDANRYKQLEVDWSPVKKYRSMADMRDEGLTKIKGNSAKAFERWFTSDRIGGHPWEICRGGNSTHISLYVSQVEQQWKLILNGSSYVRVVETVKIALALYDQGVIVQLHDADEILRMITGQDYIGLVPYDVWPRYCHACFPKEDNIIDFFRPSMLEKNEYKKIESHIYFYPLDKNVPR